MPGLFGWVDLAHHTPASTADESSRIAEMARRLCHAGDELVEAWIDPAGGFAVGRVTPADLGAMSLPTGDDRGPRAFVEGVLQGSPAHVTRRLADLARRVRGALPSLRGHFTAACWEPAPRRLTLAVDRRASRPLAYTIARDKLFFAPEVKALLAAPGVDRTLDEGAIGVFLGAGYVLGEDTLFRSIKRLSGGEALVVEGGRARVEPYARYALSTRGDGTPPRDLEEELGELTRGAVERCLVDPRRTVVFLSGGVDSRVIAGAAQEAALRQGAGVRTVTWAAPGGRERSDRDVAIQVAALLGTRHEGVTREVSAWGARVISTTYLLDGLSDVPAYHPHEHDVMRALKASGARVVLRGDECFGWEGSVATLEEALLSLNLRGAGPLRHLAGVARAGVHARLAEASAAALAAAARPFEGAHPDDAKDLLYFRHRLQGYLGSAAYLKQVLLDHRTPLVDEALLDFNARVPAALRAHKLLFCRAAARRAPELFAIPIARHGNLEDWAALLASRSPVRAAVEAALDDGESGIWDLFDRRALRAALPAIGRSPDRTAAARLERGVKRLGRAVLTLAPPLRRTLTTRAHRAGLRIDQLVLRVIVLKAWHDLFVTGDGSRGALEAALARGAGR